MRRTHESLGTIRGIVTVIIAIAVGPCGDLVATLHAATPPVQSTYGSPGSPGPDQVRRAVMNLGVGQYIAERPRSTDECVAGADARSIEVRWS